MALPQKLGKYEIRSELGSGAMGVVYEGWDPGICRRVAIKTVRRDQLDRTEVGEVLARFQREAQAAGRLTHPNIVAIYEFGEEPDAAGGAAGTAFIAMEFVNGRELKDYFDIDALLRQGIDLATLLAAGSVVYGKQFNPLVTLKALSYFDDLPELPDEVKTRLATAAVAVDVAKLPILTPYAKRREKEAL